ncbi:hypothetical protein FGU46_03105 [Methanobacterium sp. CWC-01]|uniref:hypothetical protein n=1 Tax=Methanobacterium aridiramus TaxID=2584467 RepID=UPI0025760B1D|nr:hypothetical protein [Methanobacterium sp. CWC-01]WJI09148.1 hypothetical protein FGU46_03105 [Methanobacterium sp. CWC-01]
MKEYIKINGTDLDNFLKNVSKSTEKGWEPIWATFTEEKNGEEQPSYWVIAERTKPQEGSLAIG